MALVFCSCTDCANHENGMCKLEKVYINIDGACDGFVDWKESPDYHEKYYIRVRSDLHGEAKSTREGKRLEFPDIPGFVFYTSDNLADLGESATITEKRTGLLAGNIARVRDKGVEWVRTCTAKVSDVETLPDSEAEEAEKEREREEH